MSLINMHMLEAARSNGVHRYLYTSSRVHLPRLPADSADVTPLQEEDAYPADPEDGYGWEKLYSERQCRHYSGRLRARYPGGTLPQHLRAARHL